MKEPKSLEDMENSHPVLSRVSIMMDAMIYPVLLYYIAPGTNDIFAPIILFSCIAVYRYGWKDALALAFIAPTASFVLINTPSSLALPFVMGKALIMVLVSQIVFNFKSLRSYKGMVIVTIVFLLLAFSLDLSFHSFVLAQSLLIKAIYGAIIYLAAIPVIMSMKKKFSDILENVEE